MRKLFKKVRNILGAIDVLISGIITFALFIIASIMYSWAAFISPINPYKRDKIPNKVSYRFKRSMSAASKAMAAFNKATSDKETEEEES